MAWSDDANFTGQVNELKRTFTISKNRSDSLKIKLFKTGKKRLDDLIIYAKNNGYTDWIGSECEWISEQYDLFEEEWGKLKIDKADWGRDWDSEVKDHKSEKTPQHNPDLTPSSSTFAANTSSPLFNSRSSNGSSSSTQKPKANVDIEAETERLMQEAEEIEKQQRKLQREKRQHQYDGKIWEISTSLHSINEELHKLITGFRLLNITTIMQKFAEFKQATDAVTKIDLPDFQSIIKQNENYNSNRERHRLLINEFKQRVPYSQLPENFKDPLNKLLLLSLKMELNNFLTEIEACEQIKNFINDSAIFDNAISSLNAWILECRRENLQLFNMVISIRKYEKRLEPYRHLLNFSSLQNRM